MNSIVRLSFLVAVVFLVVPALSGAVSATILELAETLRAVSP